MHAFLTLLQTGLLLAQSPPVGLRNPPGSDYRGAAPSFAEGGSAGAEALELDLDEAIQRGLLANLGVLRSQTALDEALGALREARSGMRPALWAGVARSRRKVNLSVFGFAPTPERPSVVGPFDVLDARVFLDWTLWSSATHGERRSRSAQFEAARHVREDAEDLLLLVVTEAFLRAVAWESQVEAVRAQVATSTSFRDLAQRRLESGLVAGIEVLRAEVQLRRDQQRLIVAENGLARQHLVLAQVIGLEPGRELSIRGRLGDRHDPALDNDEALALAVRNRSDLRAAEATLEAARYATSSARRERHPTVVLGADYGWLGNDRHNVEETFDLGLAVRLPIYEGGRIAGREARALAREESARADLEDLRAAIYYEVATVLLDVTAAREAVEVTASALDLARRQLVQARDRFAAGVAGNLETVEAQEALAVANEEWIRSRYLYDFHLARLDRVVGESDDGSG